MKAALDDTKLSCSAYGKTECGLRIEGVFLIEELCD